MTAPDYIEYEPCLSPKKLHVVSPSACTLRYAPLPCSQIDCQIAYRLAPPHYIDATISGHTQRQEWPLGYLALFFATIVQAPVYTGINFIGHDLPQSNQGPDHWIHFNGIAAQPGRTAHPAHVANPELPRPANPPDTYYYSDSSIRFTAPYFYAHVENMVFAVLFQPADAERLRFVVNPLAPAFGGPAWDFLWLIDDPQPDHEYRLSFRSLFKPFTTRDDISWEYSRFVDESSTFEHR